MSINKVFTQIAVIHIALFLAACDRSMPEKEYPVVWNEGFTLPAMMEKAVEIKSQDDVRKLLSEKWYSAFEVRKPLSTNKTDIKSIVTCQDYLNNPGMATIVSRDYGPYLGIGIMCKAGKLIANAKSSKNSHISALQFDDQLPNILPKQFAMIISTSESERIAKDNSNISWSDVQKVIKTEKQGSYKTVYYEEGGQQAIELMARGDFNHDGFEDWLISATYGVEGGTYTSFRIFVITKLTADGKIQLLEEISQ